MKRPWARVQAIAVSIAVAGFLLIGVSWASTDRLVPGAATLG